MGSRRSIGWDREVGKRKQDGGDEAGEASMLDADAVFVGVQCLAVSLAQPDLDARCTVRRLLCRRLCSCLGGKLCRKGRQQQRVVAVVCVERH